jgi:hypothetical protein
VPAWWRKPKTQQQRQRRSKNFLKTFPRNKINLRCLHCNNGGSYLHLSSGRMAQADVLSKIQQFSARKWDGVDQISSKYPSMKSSWGSKYFTTPRGAQCSLPRVVLYYRSLISSTCWQTCEKRNLTKTIEDVTRLNRENNLSSNRGEAAETGEDETKGDDSGNDGPIDWNEVCKMTKFAKV